MDVLHRFLQLIGKDRPSALKPYTDDLDLTDNTQSVEAQIVDRILSETPSAVKQYQQASRELAEINPYGYFTDRDADVPRAIAFEEFVKEWVEFEASYRKLHRELGYVTDRPPLLSSTHLAPLLKNGILGPEEVENIARLRRVRNEVIHSRHHASASLLQDATIQLRRLRGKLEDKIEPQPTG